MGIYEFNNGECYLKNIVDINAGTPSDVTIDPLTGKPLDLLAMSSDYYTKREYILQNMQVLDRMKLMVIMING